MTASIEVNRQEKETEEGVDKGVRQRGDESRSDIWRRGSSDLIILFCSQ